VSIYKLTQRIIEARLHFILHVIFLITNALACF